MKPSDLRTVLSVLWIFLIALPAFGAATTYALIDTVSVDISGQKIELSAGQKVNVISIYGGKATIQLTMTDGTTNFVQTLESNLQPVADQSAAQPIALPVPKPVPQKPAPVAVDQAPASASNSGPAVSNNPAKASRTKEEVDAIIEKAGNTPPDWWSSTSMTIPPGIDLTWKSQGQGANKDIGGYLWNVIYVNPGRWKEGVKLLYESLRICKGNPTAQQSAFNALAGIYSEMLGDFARGAYWAKKTPEREITLAQCYMKLDCPSAAIDILRNMGSDQTRHGQGIKLWAELGDLDTSLAWAEKLAPSDPTVAYLSAGDACRRFGKIPEALAYYQKVLNVSRQVQRDDPVNKKRAAASIDAIKLFDGLDLGKISNGTYKASSIGYVGPVEVIAIVVNHKIESVKIGAHHEKQFYSSLVDVPPQIVAKQSVRGIDTTTGATVTSEAIINATAKALSDAQNGGSSGSQNSDGHQ